jgi:hypothetical protein
MNKKLEEECTCFNLNLNQKKVMSLSLSLAQDSGCLHLKGL